MERLQLGLGFRVRLNCELFVAKLALLWKNDKFVPEELSKFGELADPDSQCWQLVSARSPGLQGMLFDP